jgi:shikimate dehydrogenase
LPYEAITSKHHLYDLVYNPAVTQFLAKGAAQGATTQNGLEMLHLQADASWEIWNNDTPFVQ